MVFLKPSRFLSYLYETNEPMLPLWVLWSFFAGFYIKTGAIPDVSFATLVGPGILLVIPYITAFSGAMYITNGDFAAGSIAAFLTLCAKQASSSPQTSQALFLGGFSGIIWRIVTGSSISSFYFFACL